jgi:hypothetical protein
MRFSRENDHGLARQGRRFLVILTRSALRALFCALRADFCRFRDGRTTLGAPLSVQQPTMPLTGAWAGHQGPCGPAVRQGTAVRLCTPRRALTLPHRYALVCAPFTSPSHLLSRDLRRCRRSACRKMALPSLCLSIRPNLLLGRPSTGRVSLSTERGTPQGGYQPGDCRSSVRSF